MTVIENSPDIIFYNNSTCDVARDIINNDRIEEKLHVIMVISNPCEYNRRIKLAKEFIARMEFNDDIILYIVELAYENQEYTVTSSEHPRHLQLRGETVLWHKENMINLGVERLLPSNWKAVAWIDADIEFENINWADNCLRILNGSKDIVQLFSVALDMDRNMEVMRFFKGFGYQYSKYSPFRRSGNEYWHPGYAWAISRKAYERIGGLYERSILGSGDFNLALCLLGNGSKSINQETVDAYKISLFDYQKKVKSLRLGYIPGIIRHYFHGSKENRKYTERWKILVKHRYNPITHVTRNSEGVLVATGSFPKQLKKDIMNYFVERKEDD